VRYAVEITPAATRQIRKLHPTLQARILGRISGLADVPRPPGCTKLTGRDNLYRLRVGDFRVLYSIVDAELIILIVKVAHRREVYE